MSSLNVTNKYPPNLRLQLASDGTGCIGDGTRAASPKQLLVVVTDPCQPAGEYWCYGLSKCSVAGQCVATDLYGLGSSKNNGGLGDIGDVRRPVIAPKNDTSLPSISLSGLGILAIDDGGQLVTINDVPYGSQWTDPGAIATDVNGQGLKVDISSRIQSYGSASVDTSVATPPSAPSSFAIQYTVDDEEGNSADPVWRLIRVVCVPPEVYCTTVDADTGRKVGKCTMNGVCLEDTGRKPNSDGVGGISNASSNASSSTELDSGFEPGTSPYAPRIELRGPRFVELNRNDVFDRCPPSASLQSVCDPGARAFDPREGNLDRRVTVCGQPLIPVRGKMVVPVLLACGASTQVPGSFNLTYSVQNSAGASATTWRQITVRPVCPLGERLCDDRVTCSQSGSVCTSELFTWNATGSFFSSYPSSSSSESNTSSSGSNSPPVISLISSGDLPARVVVKWGSSYTYCNGSESRPDSLCEPGALAFDPDGGPKGQALNLTDSIIACPPFVCLRKGGCAENIGEPCPPTAKGDTAKYNMCKDPAGSYYCTPLPCGTSNEMKKAPYKAPPALTLLAETAFVEYGKIPPYYLGPCVTLPANAGSFKICNAYALQKVVYGDGQTDLTDLSSSIDRQQ
ncbi:hypothetical protein PLESTM_001376700 [Pleodorina starrii]|nr:hypothetical protein PLESTM_001376700 [Pleodorina starrii]